MTIKLVTDSTCDLSAELLERYNITVVPINIQFGTDTFQENVNLSTAEFYREIESRGILPQTSQPAVGTFLETYRQIANPGDEIISLHVTAKLSGTHQSAVLAAQKLADEIPVHVIDSEGGSAGMGWMLVTAGQMIEAGKSTADIISLLEAKRPQVSVYFAVDNLKYAEMSGRVNKLASVLSSVLNIKPIIGLEGGLISVVGKARSANRALQNILDASVAKVGNQPVNIAVVHAQAPDRAEQLFALAKAQLNVQDSFLKDVAISLAVHFGPGTVGLIAYPVALN